MSSIEVDLRAAVRGEVRFDPAARALYATDASNYRHVPIGVVTPLDAEDVVAAVAACRRHDAPLLSRGGGTSLAGQGCNEAVVLDFSRHMSSILAIDPEGRTARVQPGVVLDDLRQRAEEHGLTFGPDPSTHDRCTLGGMIGNNSCGVHSVTAGRTVDNVESMEVLTYDGLRLRVGPMTEEELADRAEAEGAEGLVYRRLRALRDRSAERVRARFPDLPRRVSGYNLDELLPERGVNVARALVGSEGTCVVVLEATVRLVDSPPARSLLVLGYPDVFEAGDAVPAVLEHGPIGLEGLDAQLVADMRQKGIGSAALQALPRGQGWLLAEFGGDDREDADGKAKAAMRALGAGEGAPEMRLYDEPDEEHRMWLVREAGLGATASVPGRGDTWEGWEDSAVPPDRLGDYLRDLRALLERHDHQTAALYGHFGDACVHTRIDFDLKSATGIASYRAFVSEAADLVISYGGSLSGEHGDGQSKAELLGRMFGEELVQDFRDFRAIWDPKGRMNPGKVVDPSPLDGNLRLGTSYRPIPVRTAFAYPEDEGSFARATLRCVGVGACRGTDGGTMCPSYMVTKEEEHSTRGRARLLFEMLNGEVVTDGWRSEAVKDALDLCLACKGCKSECPVGVDMATYKAEFLSHYYARRLRPRSAYAIGLIHWGARLGARVPRLANLATGLPGLRSVAKRAAGVHPDRRVPPFARRTFRSSFVPSSGGTGEDPGRRVVLWPDTFNDHFSPQVLHAAVEVLEDAGFAVELPRRQLCCGRPLYDYGFLGLAKSLLRRALRELEPEIRAGVPIVGLEPSCVAVFRDELKNLFPGDEDAGRLSGQVLTLSELLERHAPGWSPPPLAGQAIVQGHCHHKSVLGFEAEEQLIGRTGLDADVLDSGCCGMAGSFGFETEHYDVSVAAGERVLLPAVRAADRSTLLLADGFSCREQIAQCTDRRAVHLAEALAEGVRARRG
ncbi:MAG: FAD-binding oxidoreductase [Acidimicrobiia bacterium]|nr:FAD-binding oxidoreductase [Acidimicrobiia bacterium]